MQTVLPRRKRGAPIFFEKMKRALDEYEFDGIYNDTGCEQYLCLSNLSDRVQTVDLSDPWLDRESGAVVGDVTLAPNALCFLKKI